MADEDLGISWYDSAFIPMLNAGNVLEYFGRSKFYDRTCNNEIVKMQRQSAEQLLNMTGVEYKLVHVQQPILYIIRKQYRQNAENVTPMAHFYIIAGIVYKAPDLCTLVNSRMLNTSFNLNVALNKAIRHSRYHPSKGYWWDFSDKMVKGEDEEDEEDHPKEQASWFQRQRVDLLLGELVRQYPMKVSVPTIPHRELQVSQDNMAKTESNDNMANTETRVGIKRELPDAGPSSQPNSKMVRVKAEPGTM